MRRSGILLHISSLPSPYGIGTFGKSAYEFVDFLHKSKQTYWQILPLGPTSYGDSPYQTFSAFALNPYFIDLDYLVDEKLLNKSDIIDSTTNDKVNYEKVYFDRFIVLRKAFDRFNTNNEAFINFLEEHSSWVHDYALFMSIKQTQNDVSWISWEDSLRLRDPKAIEEFKSKHQDDINFQLFMQFKAYQQWYNLKNYANQKEVHIIGDMPIYVSLDSSDVWTCPKYFQLDENRMPKSVAGVPPDNFSPDGQLWGNPLYDWDYMKDDNYNWWIKRVDANTSLFDWVRIDHFIGFVRYFSIPFGDKTARNGEWIDGPKAPLFDAIQRALGKRNIIAEDLGALTQEVIDILKYTGYPGMKLLQFGFDASCDSDYLPHHYIPNSVVYTGTHDNHTTKAWFDTLSCDDYNKAIEYINHCECNSKVYSLIKATLASVSNTAIIPIQDYLELGDEARMNIPATLGNNWDWRLKSNQLTDALVEKIKRLTLIYGRI